MGVPAPMVTKLKILLPLAELAGAATLVLISPSSAATATA